MGLLPAVCVSQCSCRRRVPARVERAVRMRDRALAAAPDGIVITDATTPGEPVMFVNPAFTAITGWSRRTAPRPTEPAARGSRPPGVRLRQLASPLDRPDASVPGPLVPSGLPIRDVAVLVAGPRDARHPRADRSSRAAAVAAVRAAGPGVIGQNVWTVQLARPRGGNPRGPTERAVLPDAHRLLVGHHRDPGGVGPDQLHEPVGGAGAGLPTRALPPAASSPTFFRRTVAASGFVAALRADAPVRIPVAIRLPAALAAAWPERRVAGTRTNTASRSWSPTRATSPSASRRNASSGRPSSGSARRSTRSSWRR